MTRARELADWGDQVPNAETAWTSYTPAVTGFISSVGNGTIRAAYKQIGKTVFVRFHFTLGSTTTLASAAVKIPLPVNAKSDYQDYQFLSYGYLEDAGTALYQAAGFIFSDNALWLERIGVSGSNLTQQGLSSTTPFTWTTNDTISVHFTYEAA